MRKVADQNEIKQIDEYMRAAAKEAKKSTCAKSQRGVVIVKDGSIIGRGHNKVTIGDKCEPCLRDEIKDNSRVELCYAIHAEQLAILDAARLGNDIAGATMYHIKVKNGEMRPSSDISCTVCSRIVKESLISEFVLWHPDGYTAYTADEFNQLSFEYFDARSE